jgi:predicted dehydrogenase
VSVVNSVLSPRETSYLRIDFADATVEVEHLYGYRNSDWRWTPAAHVDDEARIASWAPADDLASSHAAQFDALVDAFEAGMRPQAGGADGRRVMELITGMYRSAVTGERVRRADLTADDPFSSALDGGAQPVRFAGALDTAVDATAGNA